MTTPPVRVLIVDDYPDAADTLAIFLELRGYQTRTANLPGDAIDAVAEFRPDVLVVDVGLPRVSGYALAGRLCEILGRKPLLVAITGYQDFEERSRDAGFDLHFLKPVDSFCVAEAVANSLANRAIA